MKRYAPSTLVPRSCNLERSTGGRVSREIKGEDTGRRAYIIEEKSSHNPVGWATIRIHLFQRRATAADVGLALGEKNAWNKGYGTETSKLLLDGVFRQLNLHRAEWWTFSENIASIQLARKLGFKEEARLRDAVFFDNHYHHLVVFGVLKPEFESIQAAPRNISRRENRQLFTEPVDRKSDRQ
jgi:RimJ/RimL family protein N-acetyltransferase